MENKRTLYNLNDHIDSLIDFLQSKGIDLTKDEITEQDGLFINSLIKVKDKKGLKELSNNLYSNRYNNTINPSKLKKIIILAAICGLPIFFHIFALIPICVIYALQYLYLKPLLIKTSYKKKSYLHSLIKKNKREIEELFEQNQDFGNTTSQLKRDCFEKLILFYFSSKLTILQYRAVTASIKEIKKEVLSKKFAKVPLYGALLAFFLCAIQPLGTMKELFEKMSLDAYVIQAMSKTLGSFATIASLLSMVYMVYELLHILLQPVINYFYKKSHVYRKAIEIKNKIKDYAMLDDKENCFKEIESLTTIHKHLPLDMQFDTRRNLTKDTMNILNNSGNSIRKFVIRSASAMGSNSNSIQNTSNDSGKSIGSNSNSGSGHSSLSKSHKKSQISIRG